MTYQDDSEVTSETDLRREGVHTCPMCGGARLAPWRAERADARGTSSLLDYVRCQDCDCRVQTPRVVQSDIGRLYDSSYAPFAGGAGARAPQLVGLGPASSSALRQHLGRVYTREQQGCKRVLDFGCGSSTFVNEARDLGWDTVAADFAESGLVGAREAGHAVQVVDESFWKWLETQQFDVIRMSHVIEHLYHPGDQVGALVASLVPGGVLHVITPDPDGPACTLLRRHSNFFELVHVTLIPPRSLVSLADRLGVAGTTVIPEATTKDLWRSWLLSTGRAASYEVAAEAPRSRVLQLLLRGLSAAFAKTGRNDRYHAFIVR